MLPTSVRRPLLGLAVTLAAGSWAACSLEHPALPSWESEWRVPLGAWQRSAAELIGQEPGLQLDAQGVVQLSAEGELDPTSVGDRLQALLPEQEIAARVGEIELEAIDPLRFSFGIFELHPPASSFDGQSLPIPPFQFAVQSHAQDLPRINSASVELGTLSIALVNGLPIPIGGDRAPERLRVELLSAEGELLRETWLDGPLAPGQRRELHVGLKGVLLPDSLNARVSGGSLGSGSRSVRVDAKAALGLEVSSGPISVNSAEAEFGPQRFETMGSIPLPDSMRVQQAELAAGVLQLEMRHDFSVPLSVELAIDGLLDPLGKPTRLSETIEPGAVLQGRVDLGDHRLDFGEELTEQLSVRVVATTQGSGEQAVPIRATDGLALQLHRTSLVLRRLTGTSRPLWIQLSNSQTTVDLPTHLAGIELQHAELSVDVMTSTNLPASLHLHLEGRAENGTTVPLEFEVAVPADELASRTHTVILNENNSGLLPFLNNLPTEIRAGGWVRIGDGATVGTVQERDVISARYRIGAPLRAIIREQVVELGAERLELDRGTRDKIERRLVQAELDAQVQSSLPFAVVAWVGFDLDPAKVHDDPALLLGPIEVPASVIQRSDGSRELMLTQSQVRLDRAGMRTLSQPELHQALRLVIPGSNGSPVTLRGADRIELRGFLRARVRLGDEAQ